MPNTIHPPVPPGRTSVQLTDRGVEVADGTNSRVQLGDISPGKNGSSYGLKVISSDGSTVVIDGTSDVFKIQASGSLSVSVPARAGNNFASANTSVTLSGLGTFTATPAHLSLLADTASGTGNPRYLATDNLLTGPGALWAANASGGTTTFAFIPFTWNSGMYTNLNGSSQVVVTLFGNHVFLSATSAFGYYYVLAEAAM